MPSDHFTIITKKAIIMAVLETIRVKFGVVITALIAIALLSFIIDPTTLQNVASSMSSKYDVGEIDGKSVSYVDFQKDVEKTKGVLELLGFQANSEQAQSYVRDSSTVTILYRMLKARVSMSATRRLLISFPVTISPL